MGKADSIPARILLSLLETAPFPIVYPATAAMTLLDHSFTPSSASSLSNNSVSQSQQQQQKKKQHLVPLGAAPHALESVVDSGYPSPGLLVDGSTPRLPLDLVETETACLLDLIAQACRRISSRSTSAFVHATYA